MTTVPRRSQARLAVVVVLVLVWLAALLHVWGSQRLVAGGFRTIPDGALDVTWEMGPPPLVYATVRHQESRSFGTSREIVWHPFGLSLALAFSLASGVVVAWVGRWVWKRPGTPSVEP